MLSVKTQRTKSDGRTEKLLALFKPAACVWLKISAVAPSCGFFDELHLRLQATGTNQNVTFELSSCVTFCHYYNPHLMSFHTLPLTFDLIGVYDLGSVC